MIEFGQGAGLKPAFINPDVYLDLCQEVDRGSSYTDWEGLTDPEDVLVLLANHEVASALRNNAPDGKGGVDIRRRKMLRCLTAHWLYENMDQADNLPTPSETVAFIINTSWVLKSRFWAKVPA